MSFDTVFYEGDTRTSIPIYRIAGIFRGVKFSWMLGFVVIRSKKFMVGSGQVGGTKVS